MHSKKCEARTRVNGAATEASRRNVERQLERQNELQAAQAAALTPLTTEESGGNMQRLLEDNIVSLNSHIASTIYSSPLATPVDTASS